MSQLRVFQCPACGANISNTAGAESTIVCQFCGVSVIVPEELRRGDTPTPSAQPANNGGYAPALTASLADWLTAQATQQTGVKLDGQPTIHERMTKAAENALFELATQESTLISLPFLTADKNGPKHFKITLTRKIVDDLA